MNEEPVIGSGPIRRDQVRRLGFDPDHLTPDEQHELLELDDRLENRLMLESREHPRIPAGEAPTNDHREVFV